MQSFIRRSAVAETTRLSAVLPGATKRTVLCMGLLSFILGLAGCDQARIQELEEGVSTEADVRARFGVPEKVWEAGDMASLPMPGA